MHCIRRQIQFWGDDIREVYSHACTYRRQQSVLPASSNQHSPTPFNTQWLPLVVNVETTSQLNMSIIMPQGMIPIVTSQRDQRHNGQPPIGILQSSWEPQQTSQKEPAQT